MQKEPVWKASIEGKKEEAFHSLKREYVQGLYYIEDLSSSKLAKNDGVACSSCSLLPKL